MHSTESTDSSVHPFASSAPARIDVDPTTRTGGQSAVGPTVVAVSGEIDASNTHEIEACVQSLFARRMDVVIDLTGVSFMGSSGLWIVVGLPQIARSYGVGCAVATSGAVDRILQVVNHCRPPWVFADRPAAMNTLVAEGLWLAS
jgi:anti-anti-sigma factor